MRKISDELLKAIWCEKDIEKKKMLFAKMLDSLQHKNSPSIVKIFEDFDSMDAQAIDKAASNLYLRGLNMNVIKII